MARLNTPQQARSRDTLERIALATMALLEERLWEEITVAHVVSRAGSSVGAFYSRFADKHALLDYLDERYAAQMSDIFEHHLAWAVDASLTLADQARDLIRRLTDFHRQHRGLLRTLVLSARATRDAGFRERTERINGHVPALIASALARPELKGMADPEQRLFYAIAFTFSAMRERVLFPESLPAPFAESSAPLEDLLVDTFLGVVAAGRR